jgi:hypothetical protein
MTTGIRRRTAEGIWQIAAIGRASTRTRPDLNIKPAMPAFAPETAGFGQGIDVNSPPGYRLHTGGAIVPSAPWLKRGESRAHRHQDRGK